MNAVIFPIGEKKKYFNTQKHKGGKKAPALTFWFMEDADKQNFICQSQTLAFNIQTSSRKSHLNN